MLTEFFEFGGIKGMNICVYGSSSEHIAEIYKEESEKFGEVIAKKGWGLVFGAGKYGLMGAVSRGALKGNCKNIIGVVPDFFKGRGVLAEYCTELVFTKTMRQRKQYMEDHSQAFVMLPGGIGTYDEFFEMITLKQLGRHEKPIIIYNINGFFDPMFEMLNHAIKEKYMTEHVLKLVSVVNSASEAVSAIENYTPDMYDKYDVFSQNK